MGLGVRLKELSFHLAGKAALEPPQTWDKSCPREAEGAGEGVDAGGQDWKRPLGSRQSLVSHRHLSAVKRSGCKEVKSLPSMPKPLTFPVSYNRKHHSEGSGSDGRWDTDGGGMQGAGAWGRMLCPLPVYL